MPTKNPTPTVRVGQVWRSNDPRDNVRPPLTVVKITDTHAYFKGGFRRTRIAIKNLRPTPRGGYRLVQDVADPAS